MHDRDIGEKRNFIYIELQYESGRRMRELKLPRRIIAAWPRPSSYYLPGQSKQFPLVSPAFTRVSSPRRLSLPATASPFSASTTNLFICRPPLLPLSLSLVTTRASSLCFDPETSSPAADKAGQLPPNCTSFNFLFSRHRHNRQTYCEWPSSTLLPRSNTRSSSFRFLSLHSTRYINLAS